MSLPDADFAVSRTATTVDVMYFALRHETIFLASSAYGNALGK